MKKHKRSTNMVNKFRIGMSSILIFALSSTYALPTLSKLPLAASKEVSPESGINIDQSSTSSNKVVLNFENADIQSVIKAISKLSGKNFVIDPRVKGTVTIVSDKPISKADSYKVLESALRMQGFACVEYDGVIKVLPEADAKTYNMRTSGSIGGGQGDQLVTKVFVLSRGSANQLATVIRPLMSPNNVLSVYSLVNALIVTDYASNINRITKVINQLTDGTNPELSTSSIVVTLDHAIASDVAQTLQAYLQGGTSNSPMAQMQGMMMGDGASASVTVIPSTNSLIISSPLKSKLAELKAIALSLDVNATNANNYLHVVYLKNADADHVADVLRAVANGQEDPDLTASSSQFKFAQEPGSTFASPGGTSSGATGGIGGGQPPTRTASSRGGGPSGQAQKDMPKIFIQAEPTTNALIIQAPDAVYKNLRMIIDMLDIRRAEILIEAVLVDIDETQAGNFGIQWLAGAGNNNLGVGVLSNYGGNSVGSAGGSNSLSNLVGTAIAAKNATNPNANTGGSVPTIPGELYVGLVTNTVSIGGQTIPAVGTIADMLAATDLANVISRPTLIVMDNEEAKILVGSNIGIPSGSIQNPLQTAGQSNVATTYTRTDLGTVLQIKPLITENGSIQLDLYQEDSNEDLATANNQSGPNINKRSMRTSLIVDDGQIIALGGMVQDQVELHSSGIPGLSRIPYIGWLFSWQSREHTKKNLLLFLQPTIIKNAEGYKALTNSRYQYVVGEQNQIKASGNLVLPDVKPVTLDNQLPYKAPTPDSSGSSLNLNKDLPIIDARASKLYNTVESPIVESAPQGTFKIIPTNNVKGLMSESSAIVAPRLKPNV